jgi:hypothetical protein
MENGVCPMSLFLRSLLKAWSSVLLAVGIIWLAIFAYVLLKNFKAVFIAGMALVAAASYIYPRAMKRERLRPWTGFKILRMSIITLLYLLVFISALLSAALAGRTRTLFFVAGLFVLYMGYISIRGWYAARTAYAVSPDAATFVALAINIAASVVSLHDLLSSFGSGILADAAIVMVVISTTSTKHSIISSVLHSIQDRLRAIRRKPPAGTKEE